MSKGLSFPIRIGGRGGLRISGSDGIRNEHIQEVIKTMILTRKNERIMNPSLGSDVDISLFFEEGNKSLETMLKEEIAVTLNKDRRFKVNANDIEITRNGDKVELEINCKVEGREIELKVPFSQ